MWEKTLVLIKVDIMNWQSRTEAAINYKPSKIKPNNDIHLNVINFINLLLN